MVKEESKRKANYRSSVLQSSRTFPWAHSPLIRQGECCSKQRCGRALPYWIGCVDIVDTFDVVSALCLEVLPIG